jgi:hypothetical protein
VQAQQRSGPSSLRPLAASQQVGRDPEQPGTGIVARAVKAAARVERDAEGLRRDVLTGRAGPADAVAMNPRPVPVEDLSKARRIAP